MVRKGSNASLNITRRTDRPDGEVSRTGLTAVYGQQMATIDCCWTRPDRAAGLRAGGRAAVTGSHASVSTPYDPPRYNAMLIRSFKSAPPRNAHWTASSSRHGRSNVSTPSSFHPTSTMQINYFVVSLTDRYAAASPSTAAAAAAATVIHLVHFHDA